MKETILDVLMFMFQSYIEDGNDSEIDRNFLHKNLSMAGFADKNIEKAFKREKEINKIMKNMHLEVGEWEYCTDRFGIFNVVRVKQHLFYMLIFSIEELRDQEEYNDLICDSGLCNILQSQTTMDKE